MRGFDKIEHACRTDVGLRRSHNQDSHAVLLAGDDKQWRSQGHVYLVADGMGAHAVGEKASEMAACIIPHSYHKQAQQGAVAALRKAFQEANASIHARGQQNREFTGMGTTATTLVLRPEGAWVGHVGDSRAYRIRDGHIEQLSFDHSLIWEYARRQKVDPDAIQGIPSNVIVRSLGPEPLVPVDIEGPHPLRVDDVFVLCSDGLSGQVSDAELGAVASALPPEEASQFLVDLANLRGGPDNITALVIRVGKEAAKAIVTEKKPAPWRGHAFFRLIPWPLLALVVGTILAAGAMGLTATEHTVAGLALFLLATGTILAGLIGLLLHYFRERHEAKEENEPPPPLRIHRRASCRVERSLLDKLARAAQSMKQRAQEKNWDIDWADYQSHHDLAEKHLADSDLVAAFREYVRSMRPLMDALNRQRHKEEVFQPVWDKTK